MRGNLLKKDSKLCKSFEDKRQAKLFISSCRSFVLASNGASNPVGNQDSSRLLVIKPEGILATYIRI